MSLGEFCRMVGQDLAARFVELAGPRPPCADRVAEQVFLDFVEAQVVEALRMLGTSQSLAEQVRSDIEAAALARWRELRAA